jgi:hypothetical protein
LPVDFVALHALHNNKGSIVEIERMTLYFQLLLDDKKDFDPNLGYPS